MMVCTLFSLYSVERYFGVIKIIIFQNILMYILSINSVIISIMSLLSSFGSILHQYFYHLIILVIVELLFHFHSIPFYNLHIIHIFRLSFVFFISLLFLCWTLSFRHSTILLTLINIPHYIFWNSIRYGNNLMCILTLNVFGLMNFIELNMFIELILTSEIIQCKT